MEKDAWQEAVNRNKKTTPVKYSHERGLNPIKPFNNKVLEEILNVPVMSDEF